LRLGNTTGRWGILGIPKKIKRERAGSLCVKFETCGMAYEHEKTLKNKQQNGIIVNIEIIFQFFRYSICQK